MVEKVATVCALDVEFASQIRPVSAIWKSDGVEMSARFPVVLVSRRTAVVTANATRRSINAPATKVGLEKPAIFQTALALRTASIEDFVMRCWRSPSVRTVVGVTWAQPATIRVRMAYSYRWTVGTVCVSMATRA